MVYAALILHDEKIAITSDKLNSLAKAAGVNVQAYWPVLFAKFLEGKNVSEMLSNIGSSAAPAAASGAAPAAAPAAGKKEEPKKEEKKESESEGDMGFGFVNYYFLYLLCLFTLLFIAFSVKKTFLKPICTFRLQCSNTLPRINTKIQNKIWKVYLWRKYRSFADRLLGLYCISSSLAVCKSFLSRPLYHKFVCLPKMFFTSLSSKL